jgi:hypothetical protein
MFLDCFASFKNDVTSWLSYDVLVETAYESRYAFAAGFAPIARLHRVSSLP